MKLMRQSLHSCRRKLILARQRGLSSMEESRPIFPSSLSCLIEKQWHDYMLLPEKPNFIESIYLAKGITTNTFKKAQEQIEQILASRPTVKPLMKRRGLTPKGANIPEKPPSASPSVPVSDESSLRLSSPVAEPSVHVSEPPSQPETATFYVGIPDTPREDQCQTSLSKTTVNPTPNQSQLPGPGLQELSAPSSMNSNSLPPSLGAPNSSTHNVVAADSFTSKPHTVKNVSPAFKNALYPDADTLTSPFNQKNISPAFRNAFHPAHPNSSIKNSIAKKSTTPRVKAKALKDKINLLKIKYGIKDCKVVLYDYYKDYGKTLRYGEWDPSNSNKNEVGKVDKKERKNKALSDKKSKKKRDASKTGDHVIPKKIRKIGDNLAQAAVHSKTVPKVRISLKHGDDPISISMLEDSPKDEVNASSNKENIGSCDKAVWKQMPPSNLTKKALDIRSVSCSTVRIQADELSKSDQTLVIRAPQTGAQIGKCIDKDESAGDKNMESDVNVTTEPVLAGAVPPLNCTQLAVRGEPAVASVELSACSTPALSQVNDKPVISLEAYQARKRPKSAVDASSPSVTASDPASGSSVPSPKDSSHSSPSRPLDQSPKPKLPSSANSLSPQHNGFTSPNCTPVPLQTHRCQDSPQKPKYGALLVSRETLPVSKEALLASKETLPISKKAFNNASDPRQKLFLSVLAENNNNQKCVNFERTTSLPVDNMATAELDLTSVQLHLLLDRHRRTDQSQLKIVQWENCTCYRCHKMFPLHTDWYSHSKNCISLI